MGVKLFIAVFVISFVLIILGITSIAVSDKFIDKFVTKTANLKKDGELYKQWVDPPIEVYISFYLYNLKNPVEFEKEGAKPVLEEIGPFVFQEFVFKDNLVDNNNGTLTYKDRREYYFMRNMSVHDQNFKITTLNMAAVVVLDKVKYMNFAIVEAVNLALWLTGETLLITKSVNEILFGYEDALLHRLKPLGLVPSDIVGLFIERNNTVDGIYTVNTGVDDYTKVGKVEYYNYQSQMNLWATDKANMINGTDGTIMPPLIKKEDKIYIFENELCRSLYAVYNHSLTIIDDIELLGFAPDEYFYGNTSVNPDNKGFCTPADNCLGAGLLNLTECTQGVPIIMSTPHFLFAYEKLWNDTGLYPDYDKHATLIYIEPTSGLLMKANKRIQFNVQLHRDSRISMTANLPEILYPLFWVDEHFEIDKKNADKFKNEVKMPLELVNIFKWLLFIVGVVMMLFNLMYGYFIRDQLRDLFRKDDEKGLLVNSNGLKTEPAVGFKSDIFDESMNGVIKDEEFNDDNDEKPI